MTPRQKEFCRHYIKGLSAPSAARAAGYAECTAEKNAATILASESVARYLERHRRAARLVSMSHLEIARDKMLDVLTDAEADHKASAMAAHALIRLAGMADKLAAQSIACEHSASSPPSAWRGAGGEASTQQLSTENHAQQPVLQSYEQSLDIPLSVVSDYACRCGSSPTSETDYIPETDTLPTGEPAFGQRLAPLKPEVALPLPPVTINFSPLNPDKHSKSSPTAASLERPNPPTGTAASLNRPD